MSKTFRNSKVRKSKNSSLLSFAAPARPFGQKNIPLLSLSCESQLPPVVMVLALSELSLLPFTFAIASLQLQNFLSTSTLLRYPFGTTTLPTSPFFSFGVATCHRRSLAPPNPSLTLRLSSRVRFAGFSGSICLFTLPFSSCGGTVSSK